MVPENRSLFVALGLAFLTILFVIALVAPKQREIAAAQSPKTVNRQMLAKCPNPCITVSKDLGNYVISGTLHVTLSPEEARIIMHDEEQTASAIAAYSKLVPIIESTSQQLQQNDEEMANDKDELKNLIEERSYLLKRAHSLLSKTKDDDYDDDDIPY